MAQRMTEQTKPADTNIEQNYREIGCKGVLAAARYITRTEKTSAQVKTQRAFVTETD